MAYARGFGKVSIYPRNIRKKVLEDWKMTRLEKNELIVVMKSQFRLRKQIIKLLKNDTFLTNRIACFLLSVV
jgi:hypothetical protein